MAALLEPVSNSNARWKGRMTVEGFCRRRRRHPQAFHASLRSRHCPTRVGGRYEAALERIHVQTGKQDPQLVVAWRSVLEGQKPAQELQLLFAIERNRRPAVGAGYHRAQNQDQNLVQRIGDLRRLARVFNSFKMSNARWRSKCVRKSGVVRSFRVCDMRISKKQGRSTPLIQKNARLSATYSVDCPGQRPEDETIRIRSRNASRRIRANSTGSGSKASAQNIHSGTSRSSPLSVITRRCRSPQVFSRRMTRTLCPWRG